MADIEESKRVSVQLATLSTQLLESIDKQTQLEDKLKRSRQTVVEQQSAIEKYNDLKIRYDQLAKNFAKKKADMEKLQQALDEKSKLRETAEKKVDTLNKEVEELTASLFDEANNMVADARKETDQINTRNTKLQDQLHEKDTILETLTLQLKHLKKVIATYQTENNSSSSNRNSMITNDSATASNTSLNRTSTSNSFSVQELSHFAIYTPRVPAIRYDLSLYNEFLKFIAVLPYCDNIKQTSTESRLLRRLVNDEIQPVLKLDSANGLGWIVKRTLMSLMIDGLVVIEPLSGVNETYRAANVGSNSSPNGSVSRTFNEKPDTKDSRMFHFPANSPPIAVHEPCAFCGESRDDSFQHARMYTLKTQTRNENGTISVANQFPLCQHCLVIIRQTCEIFAFLRSLKIGTWNLERVTLLTIAKGESKKFSKVTQANTAVHETLDEKKMKRRSIMAGLGINQSSNTKVNPEKEVALVDQTGLPTTNIQRAWVQLCKLRSMLHWAHIGVWTTDNAISTNFCPQSGCNDDVDVPNSASDQQLDNISESPVDHQNELSIESSTSSKEVTESVEKDMFDFENNDVTLEAPNAELEQTNTSANSKDSAITEPILDGIRKIEKPNDDITGVTNSEKKQLIEATEFEVAISDDISEPEFMDAEEATLERLIPTAEQIPNTSIEEHMIENLDAIVHNDDQTSSAEDTKENTLIQPDIPIKVEAKKDENLDLGNTEQTNIEITTDADAVDESKIKVGSDAFKNERKNLDEVNENVANSDLNLEPNLNIEVSSNLEANSSLNDLILANSSVIEDLEDLVKKGPVPTDATSKDANSNVEPETNVSSQMISKDDEKELL